MSNLISNGIHLPKAAAIQISEWTRALLSGNCELYVRGYSHIFVSGPSDCPECSDFSEITDLDDSFQEIFYRASLRKLMRAYFDDSNPKDIRDEISGEPDRRNKKYISLSHEKTGEEIQIEGTKTDPDKKTEKELVPTSNSDTSVNTEEKKDKSETDALDVEAIPHNKKQDIIELLSKNAISSRRQSANSYFLSINTALIAVVGFAQRQLPQSQHWKLPITIAVAGMILSYLWLRLIRSYKDLNSGKFKVIH